MNYGVVTYTAMEVVRPSAADGAVPPSSAVGAAPLPQTALTTSRYSPLAGALVSRPWA